MPPSINTSLIGKTSCLMEHGAGKEGALWLAAAGDLCLTCAGEYVTLGTPFAYFIPALKTGLGDYGDY